MAKSQEPKDEQDDVEQDVQTPQPPKPRGRNAAARTEAEIEDEFGDLPHETDITKYHNEQTLETKEILAKKPRMTYLIQLSEKEDPKSYEVVTINGYVMAIPKGVLVSVPSPVAKILARQYNVELTAGKEMRADRPKVDNGVNISDALS